MRDRRHPRRLISRAREVLRHGATHLMLVGSAVAGVGAYAYQVFGARVLGDVAYAPIGVLWTIQFLVLSVVLYSVEAYVTRLTALDAHSAVGLKRILWLLGAGISSFAGTVTLVTFAFRESLFLGLDDLAFVAGLNVLFYGAFVIVRGLFAGADRFGAYGVSTSLESVARLGLAVPVLLLFGTTRSLAWITPFGALAAAGWWFVGNRYRPPSRLPRWTEPAAAPLNPFRFVGLTAVANAAAQLILAGGPLVLVGLGASPAEVSVFFVTTTAARAPLVLAYGGLLSRLLPFLTQLFEDDDHERLRRVVGTIAAGSVLVAAISGLLGALLGPPLIAAFFGGAFEPAGWLAAGAIAGVVLATGSVMLNQVLIAGGREARMVAPWTMAAVAGASAIALGPGDPTVRVTAAFVAAEAVALLGLVLAIRTISVFTSAEPMAGGR